MFFIYFIAGIAIAASLVVTILVRLGWLVARRKPERFWRRALLLHLVLVPIYVFVVTPFALAWLASSRLGTRGDERAYAGPRIGADGTWLFQTRESLKNEADGGAVPDPALVKAAQAATVTFTTEDGVRIRGFLTQPKGPPRCSV